MYYLIGRDLDADGRYEFIQDMDNMILTEDPSRALQMTEAELDYIDMAYLNEAGFYALEASRFEVSLLEALLFHPAMRGYRPRVAPPPRRRPRHAPPPPRHGLMGGLLGMFAPRPPKPRRAPGPKPHRAPAPRPAGGMGGPKPAGRPAGGMGGPGRAAKPAGRPSMGGRPSSRPTGGGGRPGGGAGRGPGGGRGGRGPGR